MQKTTVFFAIRFAQFCTTHNINPVDAAEMSRLRDSIGQLSFKETGGLTPRQAKQMDKQVTRLQELATQYKLSADFNNPYPCLRKGGAHIEIPNL